MDGRLALASLFALLLVVAGCTAPSARPSSVNASGTGSSPVDTPADAYSDDAELPINESDGLNETELDAVVDRAMRRVEQLRDVEFRQSVPVDVISRETYRREYVGNRSVPETRRTFANALYEALFLVGEDEDAVQVRRGNLGESVVGFYTSANDRIVLVSDDDTPSVSEPVLAHELIHALQDDRSWLRTPDPRTVDRHAAYDGLVEGDARFVERRYAARCAEEWSCVSGSASGGGGDVHFGLFFAQYFPYSDGADFVRHVYDRDGWSAVDALYDDPPESAEQVIVHSKYGNDSPRDVRLRDRSSSGWSVVEPSGRPIPETLGQSRVAAMFAYTASDDQPGSVVPGDVLFNNDPGSEDDQLDPIDPYNYDFGVASGWDGDSLRVYRNESGATAYTWRIVLDSPDEAREFAEGYRDLLEYWGGRRVASNVWRIPENETRFADAFWVRVDGDAVTIVNAPTVDQLSTVHRSAGAARKASAGAD